VIGHTVYISIYSRGERGDNILYKLVYVVGVSGVITYCMY
jgi:hypothetical protein